MLGDDAGDEDRDEYSRLFWWAVAEELEEKGAELRAKMAAESADEPVSD